MIRTGLFAALALAALAGSSGAMAGDYCGPELAPDVFYNFYTAPVPCGCAGAVGAQLYVSPRPVPESVGHTYITYQALMPHEFLYQHKRTYVRYNGPYNGVTRTMVTWH